jgi:hypothetical protein
MMAKSWKINRWQREDADAPHGLDSIQDTGFSG